MQRSRTISQMSVSPVASSGLDLLVYFLLVTSQLGTSRPIRKSPIEFNFRSQYIRHSFLFRRLQIYPNAPQESALCAKENWGGTTFVSNWEAVLNSSSGTELDKLEHAGKIWSGPHFGMACKPRMVLTFFFFLINEEERRGGVGGKQQQ